jgi:repressor LexA
MFDFFPPLPYPLSMATKPVKGVKKSPAPTKKITELPDGPADQNGLTPRQLKILQVIKTAVEDQGYPPTMREIGEKAGLSSTASVTYQLQILEEKGWIRRDASRGRAIEITLPGQDGEAAPQDKTRLIPLVGRIAAGNPILAEQEVEEVLPLPESIVGKGDLFLLQVKGDSMIDAAICDGDYVVIRSQKNCEKGEIVAAMIDGEATVKTWSKKDGHFWLLPANDDYAPIPADNAEILGKVTAVLRSL